MGVYHVRGNEIPPAWVPSQPVLSPVPAADDFVHTQPGQQQAVPARPAPPRPQPEQLTGQKREEFQQMVREMEEIMGGESMGSTPPLYYEDMPGIPAEELRSCIEAVKQAELGEAAANASAEAAQPNGFTGELHEGRPFLGRRRTEHGVAAGRFDADGLLVGTVKLDEGTKAAYVRHGPLNWMVESTPIHLAKLKILRQVARFPASPS